MFTKKSEVLLLKNILTTWKGFFPYFKKPKKRVLTIQCVPFSTKSKPK